MMNRHTLIQTNYDAENHMYQVLIGTDIGSFWGSSICREEDYQFESEYFGYELAEIQAEIAYARAKRNHWDARLKALTDFWKKMSDTRTYSVDAFWVKKIRKEVDDAYNKRNMWKSRIDGLKEAYHARIVDRDASNKRLRAKGLI